MRTGPYQVIINQALAVTRAQLALRLLLQGPLGGEPNLISGPAQPKLVAVLVATIATK